MIEISDLDQKPEREFPRYYFPRLAFTFHHPGKSRIQLSQFQLEALQVKNEGLPATVWSIAEEVREKAREEAKRTGRQLFEYGPLGPGKDPRMAKHVLLIDPLQGQQIFNFPCDRSIPPGTTATFHLPLGSPLFCRLLLRLTFFTNQGVSTSSNPFWFTIRNSQRSGWQDDYKDGTILEKDIRELEQFMETASAREKEFEFFLLKYLRRRVAVYPFINPTDSPLHGLWEPDTEVNIWGEDLDAA